jgi:hypothetical protein
LGATAASHISAWCVRPTCLPALSFHTNPPAASVDAANFAERIGIDSRPTCANPARFLTTNDCS